MPNNAPRFNRSPRLGEQLVLKGILTEEALENALSAAKAANMKLGEYLTSHGIVPEEDILKALSEQLSFPLYNPDEFPLDPHLKDLVPQDVARENRLVPLTLEEGVLYCALLDPNNFRALDTVEETCRCQVEPVLCTKTDFVRLFSAVYGEYSAFSEMLGEIDADTAPDAGRADEEVITNNAVDDVPVIRLVNLILSEGVKVGASDIHINPEKTTVNVRYRVEGMLRKASEVPLKLAPSVVSRIKIMGNMDISETRLPQDGRFTIKVEGHEINVRVSSIPTTYGENVVMRLLDMSAQRIYELPKLGMGPEDYKLVTQAAHKPYGMILSTGPTGSGKSSSLYAIIKLVNRDEVNIMTLEDPVEYRMAGVRQVQLNVKAGMTFSSGLRAILRQDPDILMVGEIRDRETAHIAVQAALTGHLVLSTLHTNDALSAVNRLVDMGVEPYLVASVLLCSFAQRLVRCVCPHCREPYQPSTGLLHVFGLTPEDGPFFHGKGCPRCGGTGYMGRTAIFEVFPMLDELQEMVTAGKSKHEIYRRARELGIRTMADDAAKKIRAGITTAEEAIRVTAA